MFFVKSMIIISAVIMCTVHAAIISRWYLPGREIGSSKLKGKTIMATSVDYINFVCEQIYGEYEVRYKKMFGEYMVYVNDKPVLLVCDNTVFVKKLPDLSGLLESAECGVPYGGAKEHYILDIENTELTKKAIEILERITPVPKKRKG